MDNKKYLKAIEILAGRVLELEKDLNISQYMIDSLKEAVEKAEREASE